jgi:hypothetical protein
MVGEKDWRRCAERRVTDAGMALFHTVDRKDRRTPRTVGELINSKPTVMSKPQGSVLEASDWRKRATAESREQFVFTCQGAEFRRRAAE